LCELPGIGPATAGDLMAFAWNIPVTVIETNIRSVFIHFFFGGRLRTGEKIHDKEILPLIEKTLDRENPHEWYAALFDYGSYLKATQKNPSRRSVHHVKQTKFEGSYRQRRAEVLRIILKNPQTRSGVQKGIQYESAVLSKILADLQKDGFIKVVKGVYSVA